MATKLDITFLGVELTVTGDYTRAVPGRLSGPPEDCYPDEPSDFEIEDVEVAGVSIYEMFQCFGIPQNTSPIRYNDALDELAEACCLKLDEGYGDDDCDPPEPDYAD